MHGKYPAFNMHFGDMTYENGREQQIMGAVGTGGMVSVQCVLAQ
jgi:hypothetical protein